MTNTDDTIEVSGSGNEVADKSGEANSASKTATGKPWPPWKSKNGMLRSRVYKDEIAPLFTPERQEQIVQQVLARIMPIYSADITKRVAMKEDPPPSDKPKREPVFLVQRSIEDVKKFWIAKLANLNTERMVTHQYLGRLEAEINACNSMLDQLREMPKPNGHIKD